MRQFKYLLVVSIPLIVFILLYSHKDTVLITGEESYYVGSKSCKSCHQDNHKQWNNSSHPKIYKKYVDEKQIVADFENKPDFVTFEKKDIERIVGGKWEQVFARKIDGEYYPFPAKWMVLTQEWIPYKTKNWQNTPLRQKCDGCHSVGLDTQTGDFTEFGVGCESCHGPGSLHVQNKSMLKNIECTVCHGSISSSLKEELEKNDDIILSNKSAVCGQCHSRGNQIAHEREKFNFPLEYLPGQDLNKNFIPTTLQTDPKMKNWWGNGISKNRHQEYADFAKSKHARSLKNLRIKRSDKCGEPKDSCLKCHSADYIMANKDNKPTLQTAQQDITCVVCHDPHNIGDKEFKAQDKCKECHDNKKSTPNRVNDKHYPCPTNKVTCADCHMPRVVKTGGKYSLRSHAFKIIPPEATLKHEIPNSCQNGACHADKSVEWAIEEFEKFYKKNPQTLSEIIKNKNED